MRIFLLLLCWPALASATVVGSKADVESFILGELAAQTLEKETHTEVTRRFGIGGTGLVQKALLSGDIDLYPEYTGTIVQTLLKGSQASSIAELNRELAPLGLIASEPLGFDNSYALAVRADYAREHDLHTIGDLARVAATVRVAFSSEFMSRSDGYAALGARYGLDLGTQIRAMAHSLAYEAIAKNEVDLVDVYTTDAKIDKLNLTVLRDNLGFFPRYLAVYLARQAFAQSQPAAWAALQRLGGSLSVARMRALNGEMDIQKKTAAAVVAGMRGSAPDSLRGEILQRTKEHMVLVGVALLFALLFGVPLGVLSAKRRGLGQLILLVSGVVQTIPSLALLCFLIPPFGIGLKPALIALCLYSLLPVVLNTFTGLRNIDAGLLDTSRALGLGFWDRLRLIEIPLASPSILAGLKTSAILSIGTATLAALIGAGGYGATIIAGLAVNDLGQILGGAIPAACMALLAYALFYGLERVLLPKGLN